MRRTAAAVVLAACLASGLLGAVPQAAAAEPSQPSGPDVAAVPGIEPGKPVVPAGMEQANDPGDARKSPLPDNESAGVGPDHELTIAKAGDGAGGDVALPPHPGEKRKATDHEFDESKADLVDQDATSRTFQNPDGSFTTESSADVERVQDGDGNWQDIDLSLSSEGDHLETDTALVPVSIAKSADDELGTMEDSSSATVEFNVPLKNESSEAQVVNNETAVRYDDILREGIDLTIQPVLRGIKSTYTVPSVEAADIPIYETLTLPAGWTARQGDRVVEIVDAHGVLKMTWSGGPSHDAATPRSNVAATMRLVGTVGRVATAAVELPEGWATSADRSFPIVVDPVHQFNGSTTDPTWGMDTYVRNDLPSSAGSTTPPKLYVGKNSSGATFRSFMRFNAPAGNDVVVYDAYLRLAQVGGSACADDDLVAYRNTSGWNTSTPWTSQPTVSYADSSWFSLDGAYCDGSETVLDVTDMTQEWSDYGTTSPGGGAANYGVTLQALNESTTAGYHEFSSAEGATPPRLVVTYDRRPVKVAMTVPANDVKVGSLTPILSASTTSDLDGDPVQYNFRIATGPDAESGQVYDSDWQDPVGGTVSWQVPPGLLTDGETYYWHVYAYDGPKDGSDGDALFSDPGTPRKFQVDLRLGASSVTPMDAVGPVSVNLATGNVFASASLKSANTASGALGLSLNYNSHATSNNGLLGEYYSDWNQDGSFTGEDLLLTRRDPNVSFWWGNGAPNSAVPADYFLARWTGYLTVPTTGDYYFGGKHDDGMRVTIANGDGSSPTTMLDKWTTANTTSLDWSTSTKHLTAGQPNRITVDLREQTGGAAIALTVQDPSGAQKVVPPNWFSASPTAMPQGWSLSSDADGALSYLYAKDQGSSVVFTATDGSVSEFKLTNGAYVAPPGDAGMLMRDSLGQLTLRAADGQTYNFNSDGSLKAVTSSFDDTHPATLAYTYGDIGGWLGTKRLTKVTDPVSGRYLSLTYNTGVASTCDAPVTGLAVAPLGMLDRVDLRDGTGLQAQVACFYYWPSSEGVPGQLARIVEDPGTGNEITSFGYNGNLLTAIRDSLNSDIAGGGGLTTITYDSSGDHATHVQSPSPDGTAAQPGHTYSFTSGRTDVHVDGLSGANEPHGYARRVEFDESGKTLRTFDTAGLQTTTEWNSKEQVTGVTTPDGLKSTTTYDWADRPVHQYGPTTASCLDPVLNTPVLACAATVPDASTAYDEGIQGLAVAYYDNKWLAGSPKFHDTGVGQPDGTFYVDWGTSSPVPGLVPADGWSMIASGDLNLHQAGNYVFQVFADDGVRLYIDDTLVINSWGLATNTWLSGNFFNTSAPSHHRIRIEYFDETSYAKIFLAFTPPGGTSINVPGADLSPKYGLPTTSTDADGKVAKTEYGADPELGLPTATVLDPAGLNLRTQMTYESRLDSTKLLRQLTKTLPKGSATTSVADDNMTTYEYYGKTESVDNPCVAGTQLIPQGGLAKKTIDPDPDLTGPQTSITNETVYDYPWGRPIASRVNSDAWACTTYDDRGRVTNVTDALGRQDNFYYGDDWGFDPLLTLEQYQDTNGDWRGTALAVYRTGQVWQYADELTTITGTVYDQASRPTQTIRIFSGQPQQTLAETHYDVNGRVDWTKEYASGTARTTTYQYDSFGRPTTSTLPNGIVTTSAYNSSSGAVDSITDSSTAAGTLSKWIYQRSKAGRITSEGGEDRTRTFDYDGAGRLSHAHEGVVDRYYAFDKNTNRCANTTTTTCASATFSYDNADRITASPQATSYTYDAHGNTTQINYSGSTSGALGSSFSFTSPSTPANEIPFTVGSGGAVAATATLTASSSPPNTAIINQVGSLAPGASSEQTVTAAANGTVNAFTTWSKESFDAGYASVTVAVKNAAGTTTLASTSSSTGTAYVAYTGAVSGTAYKVVVTNNSTTQKIRSFTRAAGVPSAAGITAVIKDANGATVVNGTGGPTTLTISANLAPGSYKLVTTPYSGAGSVVVSGSFPARKATVTLGYDTASDHNTSTDDGTTHVAETLSKTGRVLRRVVTPSGGGAAISDTTYGYADAGDSPAYEETTGTTTPLTTYLGGGTVDVAGVATYKHFNAHGDLIGTSNAAGAWTDVIPGDEYGLETTSRADRLSWLGQQQRSQVGIANLTRMGVRLYEPTSGRFLSVDPVDGGCANAYAYVHGDPINAADLSGAVTCSRAFSDIAGGGYIDVQARYYRSDDSFTLAWGAGIYEPVRGSEWPNTGVWHSAVYVNGLLASKSKKLAGTTYRFHGSLGARGARSLNPFHLGRRSKRGYYSTSAGKQKLKDGDLIRIEVWGTALAKNKSLIEWSGWFECDLRQPSHGG